MTGQEAIRYIHSVSWKGSVPGLSRTRELLSRMGNPEKELKFLHIVGTNGKGSTAAMLASILRAAGYRTGLYTSPFLFRFHERMQVDGQEISNELLAEITAWVQPMADAMDDHPTEFELVTAIAMEYFRRQKAQIVVLEAGMGGALDSTNVIAAPEAAVICNIGFDHMAYLGSTLEQIAATKAEIVKPGTVCVYYPSTVGVEAVIRARCEAVNAPLYPADFGGIALHDRSLEGQVFSLGGRKMLRLPLLGEHQLRNAAVVLRTVEALTAKGWQISEDAVRRGLETVRWRGRFEILQHEPLFIVDGGHNPQCMEALTKNIRDYLSDMELTILTGVLADKDFGAMYDTLLPYAARFITVTPDSPRAMDGEALAEYLRGCGRDARACATIPEGVQAALDTAKAHGGAVLSCGSLYLVGDVVRALEKL